MPEHHARRELSLWRMTAAVLVAVPIAVLLAACGDSACPMRAIDRRPFEGTVSAFAFHDVVIGAHSNLEVDLASAAIPGQVARADAFLTPADCTQLFDGAYPGAAPRCQVLIGPVAPGTVSSRRQMSAGAYRVFVQGYTANTAPAQYAVDVGAWGRDCSPYAKFAP